MSNILCVIFVFLTNITIAQDKIKFGYHSPAGKAKVLNTEEIEKSKKESELITPKKEQETLDTSVVIHSSDSVFSIIKDTITISVLLPFYIDKNDTLIKYLRENEKDTNQIYNKSKLAISFLEGILLAVDTLEKLGVPVVVHVFDTENNIDTLKKIVTDDKVKSSNILFGPIYSKNFNLVRNFFRKDTNKVIINPLSKKYNFLKQSENVYFIRPFIKQHRDSIVRNIIKNEKDKKLSIVSNKIENKEAEYFILKNRFSSAFQDINYKEFQNLSSINKSSFGFLSDQENIVLILSEDKSFIKKVVTFCGASDSLITIYAQEPLKEVLELNTETLMKLEVHIPVSNYFNRNSLENKRLLHQFESKFSHQMDDYSLLSFRSILHFCSDKKQFSFIKFSENGGYINSVVMMCVYKDYNLYPLE